MKFEKIGRYAVRRYDSLKEYIEQGDNGPGRDKWKGRHDTWTFGAAFPSYEQTREALLEGRASESALKLSAEMRDKMLIAMDSGDTTGWSVKRRPVWMDQGDEPDPDRVLERRENCWRTSQRGKRARVIRLGINTCLSCWNSERDFASLIGTAAAISDTISRLGHGLEIVGMHALEPYSLQTMPQGTTDCVWYWPVKRAGEPLDLERICSLALPGLLRSIGFRAWEADNPGQEGHGLCYIKEPELKEATGVDYLITQSWFGHEQAQLFQGLAQILGEELEPVEA